jgi:hypothetical protein
MDEYLKATEAIESNHPLIVQGAEDWSVWKHHSETCCFAYCLRT